MHACLWEKYLSKLDKLMSGSPISLSLQYCNRSLSVTITVIHILPWEVNSGSYFSRAIFRPLPKEIAKYHCSALSLSILHAHFRMIIL